MSQVLIKHVKLRGWSYELVTDSYVITGKAPHVSSFKKTDTFIELLPKK